MATTSDSTYIPGVCNINRAEIANRRKAGHIGLALFIIGLAVALGFSLNRYFRLILIAPAFLAAIGYLQARNKFCVGYASAGQQNAREGSHQAQTVADTQAVVTDKKRARTMNLQAAAIAAVLIILALVV